MERSIGRIGLGLSFWFASMGGLAAEPEVGESRAPTAAEIAGAVERLSDDDPAARDEATMFLWRAGRPAEGPLRQALVGADPEASWRAKVVLDKLAYGLTPTSPPEIVALADRYRLGDSRYKPIIINQLFQQGVEAYPVLLAIMQTETDAALRRSIDSKIVHEAAPKLIAHGDFATAESVLRLDRSSNGMRNYAAFLLLRGTLEERIGTLKEAFDAAVAAESKNESYIDDGNRLVYLLRAQGQTAAAVEIARALANPRLEEALAVETGDWGRAADVRAAHPFSESNGEQVDQLGFLATYQRLAGRTDDHEQTMAAVRDLAGKTPEKRLDCAEILLLNDRPEEAIELMIEQGMGEKALDLLGSRGAVERATQLIEKARAENTGDRFEMEMAWAKMLKDLGETARAREILVQLADDASKDSELASKFAAVVAAELELGFEDLAIQHAGRAARNGDVEPSILAALLPDHVPRLDLCFQVLRPVDVAADLAKPIESLFRLLRHRMKADELRKLSAAAEPKVAKFPAADQAEWYIVLSEAFGTVGDANSALAFVHKAIDADASSELLIRLGDHQAELQEWEAAAERYAQAREKERVDHGRVAVLPIYLEGWARRKAGREQEGMELIATARLIPLAQADERTELADALEDRGLEAEAAVERELMLRTGPLGVGQSGDVLRHAAILAEKRGDWRTSARLREQSMLIVLRPTVHYVKAVGYLIVPALIHRIRAKGLLGEGETEAALREAEACQRILPADISLALALVPVFDRKGDAESALALFRLAYENSSKLVDRHPQSARLLNDTAWLAAKCHRELPQALEFAKKAVEREPRNAAYVDTLAEVHFHLGDRDEAIRQSRRCVELEPDNDFFEKQVQRFQDAELPSTSDMSEEVQ